MADHKIVWQKTPQTRAWFQAVGPSTQATHALLASTTGPIGSRGPWCKGGCPYNTVIQRRNRLSPLDICLHSRTLGFSGVEIGVMIILDNLYTALVSDLHKLTALYNISRHFVETVRNRGDRQTWKNKFSMRNRGDRQTWPHPHPTPQRQQQQN